jgi:hypothetical protein
MNLGDEYMASEGIISLLLDNIYIIIVILLCVGFTVWDMRRPDKRPITDFGYFKAKLDKEWKKEDWVETKIQSNLNNGKMIKLENKNGPEFTSQIEIDRRQRWGTSLYGEAEVTLEKVYGKNCLTIYYIPYSKYHECKNSKKKVKEYIKKEYGNTNDIIEVYNKTIIVILRYNEVYSASKRKTITVYEHYMPMYRGGTVNIIETEKL